MQVQIMAPIDAEILLTHGDRVVVPDSTGRALTYQVYGPRNHSWRNSLTGWRHRWYSVAALSTDG